MGATVTCDKRVAAFRTNDVTTYVLYEQTYEKNVCPHTPSWGCIFVGGLEETLRKIFRFGSICEGGMLQTSNGWTAPEAYIAAWLKELRAPGLMGDCTVDLWSGKSSFLTPIEKESEPAVLELLAKYGLEEAGRVIARGDRVSLPLYRNAGVIRDLCKGSLISAWKLFPGYSAPYRVEGNAELGYNPRPDPRKCATPNALQVERDVRLIQREDGSWYCGGPVYDIVSRYVEDAWQQELTYPGSFRDDIKRYRNAVKNVPRMPAATRVRVSDSPAIEGYRLRDWEKMKAKYPTTRNGDYLEIEAVQDALYDLCRLAPENATWVPHVAGTPAVPALQGTLF